MSTRRGSVKSCQRESIPGVGELVGRLPPYTRGGAGVSASGKGLEAEASSQRDDAGSKSRLSSAEVRVVNFITIFPNFFEDPVRTQFHIVNQVVAFNSKFHLN